MKSSVIIPCHPRSRPTLARARESVELAARGFDVEIIVVDDVDSRGLSWARNEGMDRSRGEVLFFVDADDTVRPGFISGLLGALDSSGADFVLSNFDYAPLKRDYNLVGNDAVREAMLPAFFGYSFDDVRRWNRGGRLDERREQGGVWRCAFRHEFLDRHRIRFDEGLRLYEDSPFIAECAARADRVASIGDVLYDYVPGPNGILATTLGSDRYYEYKFAALENRKAIARRVGGGILEHFAASAVFSALELMKTRRGFRRYAADRFVGESMNAFPVSWRHPLVAAALGVAKRMRKL